MKNHARWYIALALCGALVLAGCGASSSAGTQPGETPTGNLTPEANAPLTAATPAATLPAMAPTATESTATTPLATDTPGAAATATMALTGTTPTTAPTEALPVVTPTAVSPVVTATETLPGLTPTVSGAPGATTGGLQDISKALHGLADAKAFRMTTTITDTTGQTTKEVAEFVLPDRLHFTTPTDEYIVINSSTNSGAWQRSNGGQWQKLAEPPTVASSLFALVDPAKIDQLVQSIDPNSVQSPSTDTLNGKAMKLYEYSTSGQVLDAMLQGKVKVWVGQDDGLLYQTQTVGTAGATVFSMTVTTQMTVNSAFEYDSSITIEPPM